MDGAMDGEMERVGMERRGMERASLREGRDCGKGSHKSKSFMFYTLAGGRRKAVVMLRVWHGK